MNGTYYPANVTYDHLFLSDIGIRTKGQSSLSAPVNSGSDRFSFKLDINKYVSGQKLLGEKALSINNGFKDPSFLHEFLAFNLLREYMPAPRMTWANFTINDEHMGLYTVVERIDKTFLEKNFPTDYGGDLYKLAPPAGTLVWRGPDLTDYQGVTLETNEDDSDGQAFVNFLDILNFNVTMDKLPTVLNVDEALSYIAVNELLVNLDSAIGDGNNFFLYEQEGVMTVLPWDMNESFGDFTCGLSSQQLIQLPVYSPACPNTPQLPLITNLLAIPDLKDAYNAKLHQMLAGSFSAASLDPLIVNMANIIRPYVYNDHKKFYSNEQFECAVAVSTGGTGSTTSLSMNPRSTPVGTPPPQGTPPPRGTPPPQGGGNGCASLCLHDFIVNRSNAVYQQIKYQ